MANTEGKNRQTNRKGNTKPVKKTVFRKYYLNGANSTNLREYNRDTLLDILDQIPFSLVSIPVYLHKYYLNGANSVGYVNVGYVKGYKGDVEEFTVAIRSNFADTVDALGEAVIFVRAAVSEDGVVKTIIGLDIAPVSVEAEETAEVDAE